MRTRRSSGAISLPLDVIVEILSRLPVKSLFKFKCVSKTWHAFISSTGPGSLKALHDERSAQKPFPLVWRIPKDVDKQTLHAIDMVSEGLHNNFTLDIRSDLLHRTNLVSCHGLLCFFSHYTNMFHVCNPSTHEVVKLPNSLNSDYTVSIGIGYLSNTNQYKILRWYRSLRDSGENILGYDIFTLTDGVRSSSCSWKDVSLGNNNNHEFISLVDENGVCVDRVVYWPNQSFQVRKLSVLAFDLEREEPHIIQLPDRISSVDTVINKFIEVRGCLCLAEIIGEEIVMWLMRENEWVPQYRFSRPRNILTRHCWVHLLFYTPSSDGQDGELCFWWSDTILYWDVKTGMQRRSRYLGKPECHKWLHSSIYVDTLFSLEGDS